MRLDVIAIGAHPDDVEISSGGTIAKLARDGLRVGIVDLTEGELSTRGTRERRSEEASKAARILGISIRTNLRIPDGNIEVSQENVRRLITVLRQFRPRFLIIPHIHDRHPDHIHAHALCKEAWFYSGLQKIVTRYDGSNQRAFRPDTYFHFMQWFEFSPTFLIDISDTYHIKMKAMKAHRSQFYDPRSTEKNTKLSTLQFLESVEARALYYGQLIGVKYAEPFLSPSPIGVRSFSDLIVSKG